MPLQTAIGNCRLYVARKRGIKRDLETGKYAYTAEVRGKFLASKQLNVGNVVLQIYISLKEKIPHCHSFLAICSVNVPFLILRSLCLGKENGRKKEAFHCGFSSLLQWSDSSRPAIIALQVAMNWKITFSYKLNRFS